MLKISKDLSLPLEAVTQTFGILAKRGAGKTYTGCVMVEEMLSANQQVVIADPIGVWWGLRSSADGKSPGFPIVVFGGEHGDVPLEEGAGEIVAQSIVENGFSAVLDLSLFRKAAQNRFMLAFAETLYRMNRKPLHFVVDEADEFAPQRPLHGNERLLGAFEDIVRRGRARGLGVTLITQRAAVLNKNVLTQIEVLVVLRTISPQDREAIEAWTEVHGTPNQLEQLSETMASMPIGTAWFWSPGWLDVFKKIQIRQKTTFDSSATPKVGEVIKKPKAQAEVNLEQLGAQIKATAEKAKADSPTELKRKISDLERQLKESQHPVKGAKLMPGPKLVEVKNIPALTDAERTRLTKLIKIFENFTSEFNSVRALMEILSVFKDQASDEIGFFRKLLADKLSTALPLRVIAQKINEPVMRVKIPTVPTFSSNGTIPPVGQKILNALAELELLKVDRPVREMVALMSGYTNLASTGFVKAIGYLRTEGLVQYPDANSITLTEAGRSVAQFPNAPRSSDEIQNRIINLIGGKASEILRPLIAAYPSPVLREEVAAAANYTNLASTGFVKVIGRLRSLGFVEYPDTRTMKASSVLFLQ